MTRADRSRIAASKQRELERLAGTVTAMQLAVAELLPDKNAAIGQLAQAAQHIRNASIIIHSNRTGALHE